MQIYADMHIHLGQAGGRPVKITASRLLTLDNLIAGARQKGLRMVGIVDAGCQGVLGEISARLEQGDWCELDEGGFEAQGITVIPGCELETREGVHVLAYLPDWKSLQEFCRWWHPQVSNCGLSTQRGRMNISEALNASHACGGLFGFAHAFTPHKGVYGHYTERLYPIIGESINDIDFIELGLSADAGMASSISECQQFAYLSNSDAHSIPNLAREFNRLEMTEVSFHGFKSSLACGGTGIIANYGLHPLLGKYYRTYCPACDYIVEDQPPVTVCPRCHSQQIVMGVKDRITMIADQEYQNPVSYQYRVPLLMVPGIGHRTAERLVRALGSELAVQEEAPIRDIEAAAGKRVAEAIARLRANNFQIIAGGGGRYGHLTTNNDSN